MQLLDDKVFISNVEHSIGSSPNKAYPKIDNSKQARDNQFINNSIVKMHLTKVLPFIIVPLCGQLSSNHPHTCICH